jgi:putative ABC transport system permease protein
MSLEESRARLAGLPSLADGPVREGARLSTLLGFAAAALAGHRLRSVLSVAGMAVGISAVVALTALGEGARRYVIREFSALGSNMLIVLPGKVETTGAMPFGGVTNDLTLEDLRAIQGRLPWIRRVAPVSLGTDTVRYAGRGRSAAIFGTSAITKASLRRIIYLPGRPSISVPARRWSR